MLLAQTLADVIKQESPILVIHRHQAVGPIVTLLNDCHQGLDMVGFEPIIILEHEQHILIDEGRTRCQQTPALQPYATDLARPVGQMHVVRLVGIDQAHELIVGHHPVCRQVYLYRIGLGLQAGDALGQFLPTQRWNQYCCCH